MASDKVESRLDLFRRELDLHYLAVCFVCTVLCLITLIWIPVRGPGQELSFLTMFALSLNAFCIALSFLGIAPWGFTKNELIRCLVWIPTNLVAGSILTFLLSLPRAIYSGILYLQG